MSTGNSAFACRVLDFSTDAPAIGGIRYEVFSERLKWVPGDPTTKLELDDLDPYAIHIGLFDEAGVLICYVRVMRGGGVCGMLLQKPAFVRLIPDELDTSEFTAEISRLCVRLSEVNNPRLEEILVTMYRAIHQFVVVPSMSTITPILRLYATANDKNAGYMNAPRLWRLGFATLAGPLRLNGDKAETQLLCLDLPTVFRNQQFREMLGL